MKKSILMIFLMVLFVQTIYAQTNVRGTVRSSKSELLPGVNVLVKETTKGVITNANGQYEIDAPKDAILIFSFIGYEKSEVTLNGRTNLDIVLKDEIEQIDEVVVTALGIKREEKALGYSTQNVGREQIASAMSTQWANSLAGKVAGLNIVSAGGPLGTSRITLRGDVSLNMNGNNALIVLDGMPLASQMTGTGAAYGAGSSSDLPVDFGNGFSDINPDDIESIQVLKGAGATALYGSRAATGVIMITSKSGMRKNKGIGVTFNSNTSVDGILKWPDYQYEFGQGVQTYALGAAGTEYDGSLYYSYGKTPDGKNGSTSGTSSAYGPRFDASKLYYQFDPVTQTQGLEKTPWVAYPDNRKGLFRTGFNLINSVSIDGQGDKGSIRASVTTTKNEWILPNTGFDRTVASLSANYQISKRLKLIARSNYTNRKTDNTPALGYNSNSIAYFMIFQNPNVNLDWIRPMWKTGQEGISQLQPYSSFIGNPYITLYENTNASQKHSTVSNLSAVYEISRKFELMLRSGIALAFDEREMQRTVSDVVFGKGYFRKQNIFNYETNSDALLTYRESFSNGLSMSISGGANLMRQHYNLLEASVTGLITPRVYKLSNGQSSPYVVSTESNKAMNSLYGAANFSWKNKLFLDITGRNDWSSTLPEKNRSFFYPSVSTSILLNEIVQLPKQVNKAKLRISYAQVGNDTEPYKTDKYYSTTTFPGSASTATMLHNIDFKPEISSSFETGMDIKMLKNRLGIDFTFYYNLTRNQIIDAPMDASTGYYRATINAGKVRNRGYEVMVTGAPVIARNFRWNAGLTWSKNENQIMELAKGMDENQLLSSIGSVSIIGSVGGTTGDLWGYKLVRNPEGHVIIASNGLPAQSPVIEYVGSAYPSWKAGMSNEFQYKNFRLSIQFDGQFGGIVYSQAHHKMTQQGKLGFTLNGRLPGTEFYIEKDDPRILADAALSKKNLGGYYMVAPGVVDAGNGTYAPNTKLVTVEAYNNEKYRINNVETNSFDASYLKLREVRFEYSLPKNLLAKTPFEKASLAVYGRNLAMFTSFPMFDPEAAALNGGTITPGVETGQLPSTRTIGLNLTLGF
ncbi:MAG: SusC/RagA family TonB-linked outer membrane protein [Mariniphaga sp.]|nr:SusC/RagA family TonB-linked outer membrane protein [Mariniphaga sp.]